MDETVASGLQAVRQLDVILRNVIRNKFNGDPGLLVKGLARCAPLSENQYRDW